jgi:hypothetical protein
MKSLSGLAFVVCTHITKEHKPILFASRQIPLDIMDSGWEFTCGGHGHADQELKIVSIETISQLDPSCLSLLSVCTEIPAAFIRKSVDDQWTTDEETLDRIKRGMCKY